jgi:predicted TPR repeat methyltransferase
MFHYPRATVPNVYTFKDFEGSSHRILIDLIRRHAGNGGTLLDLGAAGGELGQALREHFDRAIGFEYNVDCVGTLGACFDQVVVTDLEQVKTLPKADAIVLADVLEHLRDPARALALVRNAVDENGRVFISVPNVANFTVRFALLLGMFNYQERGILDRTHIRFYTASTFRQEVERAGFRILETKASSVPVRLVIGRFTPEAVLRAGEKLLSMVTRLWRNFFAYQIIVVAQKV